MTTKKPLMIIASFFAVASIVFGFLGISGQDAFVYPSLITMVLALAFLFWTLLKMKNPQGSR